LKRAGGRDTDLVLRSKAQLVAGRCILDLAKLAIKERARRFARASR
jgi:hypothetical protein